MTLKRRLRAAAEREKRWQSNTHFEMEKQRYKRARDQHAENCRIHRRGLSLDEWHRLSCIVDAMVLADHRWQEVSFYAAEGMQMVDLPLSLAEDFLLAVWDVHYGANRAMIQTRLLIKALEAKP